MPELPEVETVRRGLLPLLVGRRVVGVRVRDRRLREPIAPAALARLRGAEVTGIRRRSKYLLVETRDRAGAGRTLLVHLGMTGALWVCDRARPARPHEHVVLALDDGRDLRFADPRRFGMIEVVPTDRVERHPRLSGLGPEPLAAGLSAAALHRATRGRRKPIKNFLMDTHAVAGVGNIYACEALHRAAVRPTRPVGRLALPAWERIVAHLRAVLREAIRAGGTTLRDFRNAEGEAGYFRIDLAVYERTGEACRRCGATIRRIVQAGRSTFYCPGCQR
jgi:formamidopyrimidine-DNA glycosylase